MILILTRPDFWRVPGSTGAGGGSAATGGGLTVTAVVSASRTVAVTSLEQCDVGDANTCRLLHR